MQKDQGFLKTHQDPRHHKRIDRFEKLFAYHFHKDQIIDPEVMPIVNNLEQIDQWIAKVAPEWPINRLNYVDLAILRIAIWEMLIEGKTPPKVVIDEAVELGKEYGSENTARFVNGVLGTLLQQHPEQKPDA